MTAPTEPGTLIELASLPNLRDIGGYPARGGRVRTGVLYRSTALDKLAGEDIAALGFLGIRTVFDLRTGGQRAAEPDKLPPARNSWSATCSPIPRTRLPRS